MSIADRILKLEVREQISGTHPRDPALAQLFQSGQRSSSGVLVNTQNAAAISAVYACVRILSSSYAALPLEVYERGENESRKRATSLPMYEVLHLRANDQQTSFEWREMSMGHVLMRGNAYSFKSYNNRGELEQLIPLHPDLTMPFLTPNKKVAYRYSNPITNENDIFLDEEILHIKGFSTGGLKGVDPITFHKDTFGHAIAAHQHGSQYFKEGTVMSGVLKTADELSDKAYKRLKKDWAARTQGVSNAYKPVILEQGLEWASMMVDPKASQLIETLRYSVAQIGRIFGIPGSMLNDKDGTSNWGAGVEMQTLGFLTFALQPHLVRCEQKMTVSLLGEERFKKFFIEFNLAGLLRGDSDARSAYYRALFEVGALNSNEIRQFENLNPREDGEEYFVAATITGSNNQQAPADDSSGDERFQALHGVMLRKAASTIVSCECRMVERALDSGPEKMEARLNKFLDEHSEFIKRHLSDLAGDNEPEITKKLVESAQRTIRRNLESTDPVAEIKRTLLEWQQKRAKLITAAISFAALDGLLETSP